MTPLFTGAWWKATGWRVLYTVLAALIPLASQIGTGNVELAYAGGLLGAVAVASFATALFRMPELTGTQVPAWKAAVYRVARTLGQTVAAGVASVTLIQDAAWHDIAVTAAGTAAVTLIRTLIGYLPESATEELLEE
ncbi:hypothetical protein [Ruania rhizosphaerae]|uniref:hypothetical protein n=1 Tax=Ruania rhizosphaerae TaxID=1840413 RepID=UPI00135CB7CD|nr:hypothetical protein [Ruania rhizosphaerae]